jgi:hypothetical protein
VFGMCLVRVALRFCTARLCLLICRSLERDKHSSEAERMQALKFVRKMMELNVLLLPSNIVHGLVSIAEHPEDNLCRVAVETLCELAIRCGPPQSHQNIHDRVVLCL